MPRLLRRIMSAGVDECEACDGSGLVYRDSPHRLGYLLAEDCGECLGFGERRMEAGK